MSYNRKAITDALSKMNKARKPKQPKDIIKDPEGQYKYPGVPTRIASDNITMQGVSYPVLGVDNLGNQQMMQPGAEYVFPGADYVDEFPISTLNFQQGGQLSPEEFAKRKAAYEKMTGRQVPAIKQTKIVSAPPVTLPVETPKKISTGYSGFRDNEALLYNPVEITGPSNIKDKWNRPRETSAWYGFDPDKKEFTSKDKWGRNPGDKKYGYDENREVWTLGSKGDKRINISKPYVFDDKQLKEITLSTDAEECLRDNDGNCLQSAFSYYDKYVAPNLGLPDSWKIKENANLSSGPNHNRYKQVGESWDSWELAGGLLEKGGKLFFTSSNNISLNAKLKNKTPEEQEKYWLDLNLPIGTIINGGFRGRNKNNGKITYNESVGLAPSNHSAVVIGHDKKGIPVIFDYGKIHKITDPTALINSHVQGINNIIAPKEVLEMTYDKIKNNKNITSTTSVKPLSKKLIRESIFENARIANNNKTNTDPIYGTVTPVIKSNLKEMYRFGDLLVDNKEKYIKNFNLPNDVYDEYVRRAIALAFVETGGGDETSVRVKFGIPYPSYKLKKMGIPIFNSFGLTQINTDVLWEDSKITKQLNNLGITEDNYDPYKLEHITAATIAMLKNTDKVAKTNIKKFPGNNTDMHPAMANWYQWNRPETFVKGTAQGDAIAGKKFMNYYNAVKFQEGGNTSDPGMDAMMKARFAYAHMHGNPAAQRMTYPVDNPYIFTGTEPYTNPDMAGEFGTHYMFSQDNYAVPTIQQDEYGNLIYNPEANYTNPEAIQFDRPEDAEYFAEYYKQIAPGMQTGGSTDWKSRIASAMNFQKGGQLSKEEFEKRKAAYKKLTGRDLTEKNVATIKQQQNLQKFIDDKKPLEKKLPTSEAEAMAMIESGELKIETIAQQQAREKREADAREADRIARLKAYEKRQADPEYSEWTGLPEESFRDMLANEAASLDAKFRFSQEDNFFDDYINPLVWIGSMAKNLGESPQQAKQTGSLLPYITAVGTPLVMGAIGGAGATNTGQFVNNLVNPVAGLGTGMLNRVGRRSFTPYLDDIGSSLNPRTISNTPRQLPGSSNTFKSEIDWAKWNPDIPKRKDLIEEYYNIEKKAKANNTWMTDSQGDPARLPNGELATPEQWVQSQSKAWEKAYGNKGFENIESVYRGVGPSNNNPDFSKGYIEGDRGIFTADKKLAQSYAWGNMHENILNPFSPSTDSGIFPLMFPKGKKITYNTGLSDWTDVNLVKMSSKTNIEAQINRLKDVVKRMENANASSELIISQKERIKQLQGYYNDFDKIVNDPEAFSKMRKVLGDITTTDNIAEYIPKTDLNAITLQNIIDGGVGDVTIVNNRVGNYLKSLKGNVGDFDMTNPNIYKALFPFIFGAGAASQYQQGGSIQPLDYFDGELTDQEIEQYKKGGCVVVKL